MTRTRIALLALAGALALMSVGATAAQAKLVSSRAAARSRPRSRRRTSWPTTAWPLTPTGPATFANGAFMFPVVKGFGNTKTYRGRAGPQPAACVHQGRSLRGVRRLVAVRAADTSVLLAQLPGRRGQLRAPQGGAAALALQPPGGEAPPLEAGSPVIRRRLATLVRSLRDYCRQGRVIVLATVTNLGKSVSDGTATLSADLLLSRQAARSSTAWPAATSAGRRGSADVGLGGRHGHTGRVVARADRRRPFPHRGAAADALPDGDIQRERARRARAAFHEPRPARLRAVEPAGDGQGRAVRALLALPGHAAAALPRRVRRREAAPAAVAFDGEEGERARKLYERIFLGYGDDSVAQLGGAHIAMEWVSNVMTKLLQRGRLAAYLEQSTRYMPYDTPIGAGLGYRYWRHPELGPEYEAAMDFLFDSYSQALPRVDGLGRGALSARARPGPEAAHWRGSSGQGARPAARPAARRLAVARGHVRHRAGLRAAAAAPLRLPAARGARLRGHDPGRAEERDAELRGPGGAPRARRRVDLLPRGARGGGRALGAAAGPRPRPARRARRPGRAPAVGRGRRGRAARGAAVRGRRLLRGGDAQRGAGAAA